MPILEQHEVAAYLLARGLVARRSIVDGSLQVEDATSRNRNFRVSGGAGESLLLKQALAADAGESLENEAALYARLTQAGGALAAAIPRLHGFDADRELLILEWVAGAEDLYRHHAGRARCSVRLSAALGRVLAALHAVQADEDDEELRRDAPWVLSLHRPRLEALRHLSAPSIELIAAIQRDPPFARALDELRDGWRVEALVHRDVKWANCIVRPPAAIMLVDWEMAGWGDPALDLGSALGEALGWRLRRAGSGADPATAALWTAYARARGLDAGAAVAALRVRAASYAGARLLQSAYEKTQETGRATDRVRRTLELAREVLLAPDRAADDLMGGAA